MPMVRDSNSDTDMVPEPKVKTRKVEVFYIECPICRPIREFSAQTEPRVRYLYEEHYKQTHKG